MNFKELIQIQTEFNNTLSTVQTVEDYHFALNVELAEFINTLPWKWWKKNHVINKEKVLDELADVMAFLFSVYDVHFNVNVKNARIGDEQKADIIRRAYAHLKEGFEFGLSQSPKVKKIQYWPQTDIPSLETNGIRLGILAKLCIKHTDCTLEDIVEAYKRKMEINHQRQKENY